MVSIENDIRKYNIDASDSLNEEVVQLPSREMFADSSSSPIYSFDQELRGQKINLHSSIYGGQKQNQTEAEDEDIFRLVDELWGIHRDDENNK